MLANLPGLATRRITDFIKSETGKLPSSKVLAPNADIFDMSFYQQDNYKALIRDGLGHGQAKKLADYLGVNPSLVSQVLSGPKDFTEEQTVLVCEFLGFSKLESRYVLALVQVARAGSVKLREVYEETLRALRQEATDLSKRVSVTRELTDAEKTRFYSSWIYAAVQLCATLDQPQHFKDVCARFNLRADEAQKIVSFLIEIGMLIDTGRAYRPGPIITHLEKSSPYVANLHRNWRLKAVQHIDTLAQDELMYTCNFSVSRDDFAKIREEFLVMIQKFLKTAQASPAEEIAQFNLDLFWVRG